MRNLVIEFEPPESNWVLHLCPVLGVKVVGTLKLVLFFLVLTFLEAHGSGRRRGYSWIKVAAFN